MKLLFWSSIMFPFLSLATPGYYGKDFRIKSKQGQFFIVEQAGYEMKIDSKKLPPDINQKWLKSVGKKFESPIPIAAIVEEKKLENQKPEPVTDR